MSGLVIYLFAVFGLAFVVGHSQVSFAFRTWLSSRSRLLLTLLECPACFSWHCGWIWVVAGGRHFFGAPAVREALLLAFASCGFSLLAGKLSGLVD